MTTPTLSIDDVLRDCAQRPSTRNHRQAFRAPKTAETENEISQFINSLLEPGAKDVRIRVDASQPTSRLLTFQRLFEDHKVDIACDLASAKTIARIVMPTLFVVTLHWGTSRERIVPMDAHHPFAAGLICLALFRERTIVATAPGQRTITAPYLGIQAVIDDRCALIQPSPLPGLLSLQSQLAAAAPAVGPFAS